jgi:hypothetical protein
MNKNDKLEKLGTAKLADALMELAQRNEKVGDYIDTLIASEDSLAGIYRDRIYDVEYCGDYISHRGSFDKAEDMNALLLDIVNKVKDIKECFDLIVAFIETDQKVYEACDDSSGVVGDVYHEACDYFAEYAAKLNEEEYCKEIFIRLVLKDDYGTRDPLTNKVTSFFSEKTLTDLVAYFLSCPKKSYDPAGSIATSIAWHLPDSNLYKKCCKRWCSGNMDLQVTKHHLYHDRVDEALTLLNTDSSHTLEKDELLRTIYEQKGDKKNLFTVLNRIFLRTPNAKLFKDALNAAPDKQKEDLLQEFTYKLMASKHGITEKILFMLETEQTSTAAKVVLGNIDEFDGGQYYSLLPLVDHLEGSYPLEASLLYRKLVLGNLEPAKSNYYQHGVRYLKALDDLSKEVNDWKWFPTHEEFKAELREVHGRKKSFWAKYDK